jgi:hypothetical protein
MKKLIIIYTLLTSYHLFSDNVVAKIEVQDQDLQFLKEALDIVGSMTDNIANIVIQNKTNTNSPEATKQEVVALIRKITDFVVVFMKKTKNKKPTKSIPLYSQEEFTAMVNKIVDDVLEKIQ